MPHRGFKYMLLIFLLPKVIFAAQKSDSQDQSMIKESYEIESIMADSEEMKKINQAFKLFSQGKEYMTDRNDDSLSAKDRETIKDERLSAEMRLIEEKSKTYLGSILYFSRNTWSIWLNGIKLTSDSNDKESEFYVEKISGKKVDFVWRISVSKWKILMSTGDETLNPKVSDTSEVVIKFSLRQNQTYLLRQGKVVEGNHRPKNIPIQNSTNTAQKGK